jgi:ankyrin repeat protein
MNDKLADLWHAIRRCDLAGIRETSCALKLRQVRDDEGLPVVLAALAMTSTSDQVVRTLLLLGADANDHDAITGKTALHIACGRQSLSLVQMLLDHNADVHARDAHGNTPLCDAVFTFQSDLGIIRLLLESGASADAANLHGVSPYGLAEQFKLADVIALMRR